MYFCVFKRVYEILELNLQTVSLANIRQYGDTN